MTVAAVFPGDVVIQGNVTLNGVVPSATPAGYLTDALVAPTAGLQYTKLQQNRSYREAMTNYGATPAAVRKTVFVATGATGSVLRVKAFASQAVVSGSVSVDVLKNGTTILSAPLSVNGTAGQGGTAYDKIAGIITSASFVAGDVFEINQTVSTPSGGGGLTVQIDTKEDPA